MSSVFTKIINGELPAYKIAENDKFLAFLDVNPNAKGHTLCIPKQEINKIFDMDADLYGELMQFSCKRVGMAVIGLEVPHVHVHLIPLNEMDEMRFVNKVKLEQKEFTDLAKEVQKYL
jgi:histidine triad (HIT) family protein